MTDVKPGQVWRHVKSGNFYRVTGMCIIEATSVYAVLYQRTDDDLAPVWCRPWKEFLDGRFERYTP